ncbi:glutathione S-transferase N-terminal domain-containing protein [Bradyrhizobium roseum]|uniref:glutathione S-transferase N-terminal domain-containing protein n=1 Tax=Bradyrhizobium roseum TaxID=3056648 RepID=UPI0026254998|nr:glutathione S-transferase C-terminal domain-containing protein [Bradyrhizobium roseus]WKA26527.1 glutathione S-transferase N-terminal domain-containing protein [Bradyrhizobium roseus]
MYRLISATPSPYARKVRIQLAEKGIPFELITEVPWNSDTQTPRHNPLEKLPVLICEDGTSVFESRYINEWIEMKHPAPALVPGDVDGILAVKRFEIIVDGMCDAMVLMFFEKAREPGKRSAEWTARQKRKLDGGLRELSRVISDNEFAHGGVFSMADIASGTVLKYIDVRWPENPWRAEYPNLAAYSDRLERRPSFASTVPVPQVIRDKVA